MTVHIQTIFGSISIINCVVDNAISYSRIRKIVLSDCLWSFHAALHTEATYKSISATGLWQARVKSSGPKGIATY